MKIHIAKTQVEFEAIQVTRETVLDAIEFVGSSFRLFTTCEKVTFNSGGNDDNSISVVMDKSRILETSEYLPGDNADPLKFCYMVIAIPGGTGHQVAFFGDWIVRHPFLGLRVLRDFEFSEQFTIEDNTAVKEQKSVLVNTPAVAMDIDKTRTKIEESTQPKEPHEEESMDESDGTMTGSLYMNFRDTEGPVDVELELPEEDDQTPGEGENPFIPVTEDAKSEVVKEDNQAYEPEVSETPIEGDSPAMNEEIDASTGSYYSGNSILRRIAEQRRMQLSEDAEEWEGEHEEHSEEEATKDYHGEEDLQGEVDDYDEDEAGIDEAMVDHDPAQMDTNARVSNALDRLRGIRRESGVSSMYAATAGMGISQDRPLSDDILKSGKIWTPDMGTRQ